MRAGDGPAADGSWAARAKSCGQSNTRGATRERHAKEGKKAIFLFLGEKIGRCFLYLLGGDSSRSAVIAALGYRPRRENVAGAVAARRGKTQLVEDCGLWPPFQLIQLIYLRYLCGSAEREKRMDVCFLLTLYI